MAKRTISLSVHQLVDFLLRTGDIDDRVYNQDTMQMGSILHARFQKSQGNDYLSEIPLEETFERPGGIIKLQGRADGIIVGEDYPIIDEIKSTVAPLHTFAQEQKEWHLGQALCYAVMYLHKIGGQKVGVRLTYLSQGSDEQLVKNHVFTLETAEKKVEGYMDDYLAFKERYFSHCKQRDASAKKLEFPYPRFRAGQRELAKYAFGAIEKREIFFAEAPTGIGKTMSVLFPAVKSLKEGKRDKIFYLTAKTTGAIAAYQAVGELQEHGLDIRDSTLVAKEKLCLSKGTACNPDECPYAKGYFTKLKPLIKEVVDSGKRFDQETILEYCIPAAVCPFEFQLDLSEWADVVICDYNYLFDPIVHLERYFDFTADPSTYIALVDEAHNLVERGRSMYSAEFSLGKVREAKKSLKGKEFASLKRALTKLEKAIDAIVPFENGHEVLDSVPGEIEEALQSIKRAQQKHGKDKKPHPTEEFLEIAREGNRYLRLIAEYMGTRYRAYVSRRGEAAEYHLLCVDPSPFLLETLKRLNSAIIFSATMSPISYYMDAILGTEDKPFLLLPSPFDKGNFKVLLAPKISVRYKDRQKSYPEVASYLHEFVSGKTGNYFIYFPSYEYMENIRPFLDFNDADVYFQDRSMTHIERQEFLMNFLPNPSKTAVGLLIVGGAFSEGVDLVDDRLIGVAVVGVGLAQISPENEVIREFRDQEGGDGFSFAYKDPGMNKVMQAVGRVIRSETDVGAALLIDDRYMKEEYRAFFARTYRDYEVVLDPLEIGPILKDFYGREG